MKIDWTMLSNIGVSLLLISCQPLHVSGLQVGRVQRNVRTSGLFSAAIVEPAGASTIFLGKRKKAKETVIWAASLVLPIRRRSLEPGKIVVSDQDIAQMAESIELPKWACEDNNELERLAEMKFLLKDELNSIAKKVIHLDGGRLVKVVDAFPDVYSDFRMLRFLRKDQLQDPASAANRYRKFLVWRQESNLDSIRASVMIKPFQVPPELQSVGDYIPCDFFDGDGVKPMLLRVGEWDTAGITRHIENGVIRVEDFLVYWAYMFESLTKKLHEDSMKCNSMLRLDQVCDLSKMSLQQFSPGFVSRVMKPWLAMTQQNYPETTRNIIFFRPPRILSVVWKMVTPFVSPGTIAKVQMKRDYNGNCDQFMVSLCSKYSTV
jgi:hypothetical protein